LKGESHHAKILQPQLQAVWLRYYKLRVASVRCLLPGKQRDQEGLYRPLNQKSCSLCLYSIASDKDNSKTETLVIFSFFRFLRHFPTVYIHCFVNASLYAALKLQLFEPFCFLGYFECSILALCLWYAGPLQQ